MDQRNMSQASFLNENDTVYIKNNVIDVIYQALDSNEKKYLLNKLTSLINYIAIRFCFTNKNKYISQLKQNNNRDLRALLDLLLPFVSDDDSDTMKKSVSKLNELYVKKNSKGEYMYTNVQYNRCIRSIDSQEGKPVVRTKERLFNEKYLDHNFKLLLYSVQTCAMKLFVNWVDIVPFTLSSYQNHIYYLETVKKLSVSIESKKYEQRTERDSRSTHIDETPGMSYQDLYHGISYLLFADIKNHKWLIYDFVNPENNLPITIYRALMRIFVLEDLLSERSWENLTDDQRLKINIGITKLLQKSPVNDKIIFYFYFFFNKYYENIETLKEEGYLRNIILNQDDDDENEDEENIERDYN